jgi:hypothetical protein
VRTWAIWLALISAPSAAAVDWTTPWAEPRDGPAAREHSDEYAWRLFVALNWPADPVARAADRAAGLSAERPVVWETWQNAADVYLENGLDPGPWSAGAPTSGVAEEHRFETFSFKDLPNLRHIVAGRMVPLRDPIAAASRLTEIRMNRAAYDYIRARELYNVQGQLRAVADGRSVHFPPGSIEVKANWRRIRDEDQGRFRTLRVLLRDGTTRLYGLTALHIVSKDLPNWFWATFEHVDNPSLEDGEGWQLPSHDAFSCRGAPGADCNRAPSGIGLEGSVWEHYRLRGTLTGFVDEAGRPQRLANSELEAGIQKSSSCITCHARSAITVLARAAVRLPIFDTSASGPGEEVGARRGYVGLPQPEWFRGGEVGGHGALFQPLDFVWSLSKAQSKRGS